MSHSLIARRAFRDCDICLDYDRHEARPWLLWVHSDDPGGFALPANPRTFDKKSDAIAEAWRLYAVPKSAFVDPLPPSMPMGGLFDDDARAQGDLLELAKQEKQS